MRVLHALVAALFVGACAPAAPVKPSPEEDRAAIGRLRSQFVAFYKAGDAAGAASLYEDQAVIIPNERPVASGKPAILEFETQTFKTISVIDIEIRSDALELMGDWAVDRGTFTATALPKAGGAPSTDRGRYVIILRRQADGSWKVHTDIDNRGPWEDLRPSVPPGKK